jgi:hypothetical protein
LKEGQALLVEWNQKKKRDSNGSIGSKSFMIIKQWV